MGQPHEYHLADGTRVPAVTRVLKPMKNADALMWWAWNEGKAGRDFRQTRDRAADAGTLAHRAVEAWVHGREPEWLGEPDVVSRGQKAFGAFLEWTTQTNLIVTHTEIPMVSESYLYGGRPDAVLVSGHRAIGDWKSSDGIYPDMLVQLAAYGKLWQEVHPEEPLDGGFDLIRFDKTYGDFHHHHWNELETAWTAFLHLRALYDLEKELKQRAR